MRSEEEIIGSVLQIAIKDDGVRAVVRTELLPVREYLHAYSFVFVVRDVDNYDRDIFESGLGERILLFRADRNYPEMFPDTKAHLMVFRDGITITINTMSRDTFLAKYGGPCERKDVWIGETYQKLLDKGDTLPIVDRLVESQTLFAELPSEAAFLGACDEFWWVMKTLAEYTLREELPAAMYYLNVSVRGLLNRMLHWHLYLQSGKPIDVGILDSNLEKLLEDTLFRLYKKTYPDADCGHIWEAFHAASELWHRVAGMVAEHRGFQYPSAVEENMLEFIRNLKHSPAFPSGEGGSPQG
ncbi:MAG: aminoglycoside 6-adenylyltransferase [Clostridia bacterium]|nr:aminoglycoside 6-adenylyltransferase [Clostridia bacterium]